MIYLTGLLFGLFISTTINCSSYSSTGFNIHNYIADTCFGLLETLFSILHNSETEN